MERSPPPSRRSRAPCSTTGRSLHNTEGLANGLPEINQVSKRGLWPPVTEMDCSTCYPRQEMVLPENETAILIKQPETRPISQEQLVAEVRGIYAGLVMIESKCIEVDNALSSIYLRKSIIDYKLYKTPFSSASRLGRLLACQRRIAQLESLSESDSLDTKLLDLLDMVENALERIYIRVDWAWKKYCELIYIILYLAFWSEFPNSIRHMCTTMPWTIWPALVVLWGVCWMFVASAPGQATDISTDLSYQESAWKGWDLSQGWCYQYDPM
jgi:hypothetical protein